MSSRPVSASAGVGDVTLSGFLLKRGHFVKSWRKRYFVLLNNVLTYSVSEGSNEKGSFTLTKTTKVQENSLQRFCFELIDDKRELILIAADESEMIEWMEMLQETITSQSFIHSSTKTIGAAKLNRIYPRQRTENTLTIKLARARALSAKNKNNTSCPYAVVMVGSDKARSTTVDSQLNPTWNETFTFPFDRTLRFARIEIWDADSGVGKDRFLGMVIIPLFMLSSETPQANWFGLGKRSSRSRVSGEIFVEVSCNVDIETMAVTMMKDICTLPELSLLPFLDAPGMINQNPNISETVSYFPGELLEDLSMHVILKADIGGECFYSNGIMLLTNYRLIFVGASRLSAVRRCNTEKCTDDARGDICTYVTIGSIVQVSMGEEPDYLNPSLTIETIRIRTCDSRTLTLLFRDTAFIGVSSIISSPSLSVDHVTQAGRMISLPNNKRAYSVNPSAMPSRLMSDDEDENGVPPIRGRHKRESLNPAMAAGMIDQLRTLFKAMATHGDKEDAEKAQSQQRAHSIASVSNLKDLVSLGEDIEDDAHYLEASESAEGPPSHRVFACLNYRVINRWLESRHATHVLRSIINASCLETAATTASPDFEPLTEAMLVTTVSCNSAQSSNETESTDTMRPVGYRTQDPVRLINAYGWSTHDPIKEFNRMSIPDAYWKLSILNSESYSLCDTYPAVVSVPISIDDATLELSAHFRSRNRFPALSWRHPRNKTSLTRCSQPLVGIGQKRSAEDEAMLQLINSARGFEATYESDMLSSRRDAAATSAPASKKGSYEFKKPLMIMDARPKINAQANQAAGKGFELPKAYQNTSIIFLEIANIHAVRSSLESLEELCCNDAGSEGSWLKNVETTGWLMHIRKILSGASRIVHCMDQEELSVLVHCSDGWDRTAQLTSLAMLMMDSHYRTLSGFIELIEKEWFAFGHKFMDRFGFSMEGWCSDDRSPVFQQFIECVYQFMAQMPHVFEINEALLIFILRGLQSGLFGNIYADCEKDRQHYHHSTLSIWNAVLSNQAAFTNPSYIMTDRVCVPVTSAKRIVLWNSWFLLWHDLVWSRIWFGRMENLVAADESFVDSLMPPMRWVDNSATKTCSDPSCGRPFTVYRRRHHCRACGLIFCERCSSHRRIVTSVSSSTLSRTCRNCAHEIDMANRFKSRTVSRPQAVGNTASKRREYNERVLVMSDGSDDEILFSPNNHAAVGSSEFGRKPRVGSIVRNFEQMGENRRSDAAAAKRRSRSFSELPN